jgi:5-methylcytosine-specific restriction endonuclease McrA
VLASVSKTTKGHAPLVRQSKRIMPRPAFTNDYAPTGKQDRAKVRAESGHRCVRCGHPYETGLKRADRGEWSLCDDQCTHKGPRRIDRGLGWVEIVSNGTSSELIASGDLGEAQWRILTVHHFDGNKSNDAWWNLLPLCQKCHLQIQNKLDPETPYFFEHSPWLKPYVAGFYAKKYEGKDLTREQVMERLEELLAYECKMKAST